MTDSASTPAPRSARRWLKRLAWSAGLLLVTLGAVYFIVTSTTFLKAVVLPRVSRALHAQVTVEDASVRPFSGITLHGLKIQTTGPDPVLALQELRLRYRFTSLFAGRLDIDELTLEKPVLSVRQAADGTRNLDPLLATPPGAKSPPRSTAGTNTSSPVRLRNFALRHGSVRFQVDDPARATIAQLDDVNISLDRFESGQTGVLDLAAEFRTSLSRAGLPSVLHTRGAGQIRLTPGPDLLPHALTGNGRHEVLEATGAFAQATGLQAQVQAELDAGQLKLWQMRLVRAGEQVAELRASGPLDLATREAQLKLEASPLDRTVLNLAGAPFGLDFAESRLQAVVQLESTRGGSLFNLALRLIGERLSVRLDSGAATPPLDVQVGLAATLDPAVGLVRVTTCTLDGRRGRQTLLRGSLSQPLSYKWTTGEAGPPDATLALEIDGMKLTDWKPLTGASGPEGLLSAGMTFQPTRQGLGLHTTLRGDLAQFRLSRSNLLVSADLAFENAATLGAAAALDAQTLLAITNLIIQDPETSNRGKPLAASLNVNSLWQSNVLTLREAGFHLPSTSAAPTNAVTLAGTLDLPRQLPPLGSFQLRAVTVDLTPILDAVPPAPASSSPAPASKSPATNQSPVEPDPFTIPVRKVTIDSRIGHLVLREVSLSNWFAQVLVESNRVVLEPLSVSANGAPVTGSGSLEFSQPGWRYQLALKADRVPLEPWVNSFQPDYRGRYKGDLVATADLKGAGFTGLSMRSNLTGQVRFAFTNAEIHPLSAKAKRLLTPIATVLRIGDIDRSPLNWLALDTTMRQGRIQLSSLALQSGAFEAHTRGDIALADTVAQSQLRLPVDFLLRRSLAQKANLLPQDAPAGAPYVALPPFVSIHGTLGDPRTELDEKRLGGVLLKSGLGIAEQLGVKTDTKTGAALQGLGDLLTGQKSGPGTTNTPSTNTAPGLLDLLRRKK